MKSAIIGFGSIGARHADILKKMGLSVSVVSSRNDVPYPVYKNIDLLFDADIPDYLIISMLQNSIAPPLKRSKRSVLTGYCLSKNLYRVNMFR